MKFKALLLTGLLISSTSKSVDSTTLVSRILTGAGTILVGDGLTKNFPATT
jgi:hypothetical protein